MSADDGEAALASALGAHHEAHLHSKSWESDDALALLHDDVKLRAALAAERGATAETEAAAREITRRDAALYAAAKELFRRQLHETQARHDFTMC